MLVFDTIQYVFRFQSLFENSISNIFHAINGMNYRDKEKYFGRI